MRSKLLVVGLSVGFALLCCHALPAQTAPKTGPNATSAAKPRAILAQNNSIRFELPLAHPAVAGEGVAVWLLSPAAIASGETSVSLRPGSRSAVLTLPWPKDGHGKPAEDVGWYRIGYMLARPLLPLLRRMFPGSVMTTEEIGRAMIDVVRRGAPKKILETSDIRACAHGQ